MKKIITTRVFKNMLYDKATHLGPDMIGFHDSVVNGEKRGCYGFLRYEMEDGSFKFVYVDTEPCVLSSLSDKILYRLAKNEKDYCGEMNHWYRPSFKKTYDWDMGTAFLNLVYGDKMETGTRMLR